MRDFFAADASGAVAMARIERREISLDIMNTSYRSDALDVEQAFSRQRRPSGRRVFVRTRRHARSTAVMAA
jgi:hypothetical protein